MAVRYKKKYGKRTRTYLAQWREHRGLTRRQLAERLDISEATQSRYESGMIPITLDYLDDCAHELQCSVVDLLSRDPDAPPDPALAQAIRLLQEAGKLHR